MKKYFLSALLVLLALSVFAQPDKNPKPVAGFSVNYNEDSVGRYTLPEVLKLNNGQPVTDAKTWTDKRRPELIKLYEEEQFGKVPPPPKNMRFDVFDKGTPAYNGKAVRKQVTVYFTTDTVHKMDLLIYLPANATKPSPLLLLINFAANNSVVDDKGVKQGFIWTKEGKRLPAPATSPFSKINVDTFVTQGFGIATVNYADIEPDFKAVINTALLVCIRRAIKRPVTIGAPSLHGRGA